jgi:H+/Cl- antiporter ClcA
LELPLVDAILVTELTSALNSVLTLLIFCRLHGPMGNEFKIKEQIEQTFSQ